MWIALGFGSAACARWNCISDSKSKSCISSESFEQESNNDLFRYSFQHKGIVVVITRWASLGKAISPYDQKWRSYLNPGSMNIELATSSPAALGPSPGTIMEQFEGEEASRFVPSLSAA